MHKLSLRKRWLLSFLAVIVIILAIVSSINGISINVMNDELLRVNTNEFNYLYQTIDMQMQEFMNTAVEISINSKNLSLMESSDRTLFSNSATSAFLDLLRSMKITNDFVSNIYIYYPAVQYIVGNMGCYPASSYWQLLKINSHLEENDSSLWMKDVIYQEVVGFFIDESSGHLFYRTTFPRNGKSVKGILILEIDNSALDNLLKTVTDGREAAFAILDSNSRILSFAGNTKELQGLQDILQTGQSLNAESGVNLVKAEGQILLGANSSYSNLKYVLLADNSQLLRASLRVTYFSYAGIFVCLLLGVVMAYFSSKKNSISVEKLAASLASKDEPAHYTGNEFDFLEQRISYLLQQNAESIVKNEEMSWRLKSSFLSKILDTSQEEPNVITSIAVFNKISFDYMQYRLLIFTPVLQKDISSQHWAAINKYIQLWGTDMETEQNVVVVPAIHKEVIAVLLNYNAEEFGEEKIKESVLQFERLVFYNNGIQCQAVYSEEFENLSLLVTIYVQTLQHLPSEKNKIARSDENKGNDGRSLFLRWEKSVQSKEYIQAKTLCGKVLTDYIESASSSYCSKSRQYAMVNTILEHLREMACRGENISILKAEEDLFTAFSDLPRLQKVMENLLMEMEKENKSHLETQQGHVAQDIKRVIDENYTQPYLGLYFIADAVGVSTSYVSKVFKQQYGIGVNDYINKMRINCAKKLIDKGNLSIRDIAISVGFSSDINFIRVFKKLEHITPGQFRKEKD